MATPQLTRHHLSGVLGPILIDLRTSDRTRPRPAVVLLHGFKGFKDWGMFPGTADRIARAGFTVASLNFSGSGVDQAGRFAWPDRFGHNTFSAELEDLRRVLGALASGELGLAPTTRFGLVGHSRGGGIAILAAASDSRVSALVTWAAIAGVERWPGQHQAWRQRGRLDVVNSRTGEVLPLYPDVLDDIETRHEALDIPAAAARLTIPWLLIHGEADLSVAPEEARLLIGAAAQHPPRVMLMEGSGHTFGATHPLESVTPDLAIVIDETAKWLGRYL
jgi:dienelactone hydrolase